MASRCESAGGSRSILRLTQGHQKEALQRFTKERLLPTASDMRETKNLATCLGGIFLWRNVMESDEEEEEENMAPRTI